MANFRFVVIGDSQGYTNGVNEEVFRRLLGRVASLSPQPSFLLFTGDLIEGDGEILEELFYWRDIVTDYYPLSMIYPAIGNHNPTEENFGRVFHHLPANGPSGYHRTVYRFDHRRSRFLCLNSNRDQVIDANQRYWLEKNLQNAFDSGFKHTFVYFHKPAFPVGRHVGSSLDYDPYARSVVWQILDRHRVDLVFNGHEHNYCRRRIDSAMSNTINGTEFNYQNAIYQIINGGGGAELHAEEYCTQNVEVGPLAVYHYVVVDVSDDAVDVSVYDLKDSLLDSFYVVRPDPFDEDIYIPEPEQKPQAPDKSKPDSKTKKKFLFPGSYFWRR